MYYQKKINNQIEKKILGYLISNTNFIKELISYITPNIFYFDISQKIIPWIIEYYQAYKKAPKHHIKDIFENKKLLFTQTQIEEIEEFLEEIKSFIEEENINEQYLIDESKRYLRKRNIEVGMNKISIFLEKGNLNDAEEECKNLSKKKIEPLKYEWNAPLDDIDFIVDAYHSLNPEDSVITFGNCLDEFLGPLIPGFLIGIEGKYKGGKTWLLQEIIYQALTNHKKVAYISMEMRDKYWSPRFYSQLTFSNKLKSKVSIPYFDCKKNELDLCNNPQKECNEYGACLFCKENKIKDYKPTVLIKEIEITPTTLKKLKETISDFNTTFGSNLFRTYSPPPYSITVSDLEYALDYLEESEEFVSNLIIIDYPGALLSENKQKASWEEEGSIWMRIKNLAFSRNCLVIIPEQIGRKSQDKDTIGDRDTRGYIGKRGIADIMLTINHTEQEKNNGIARLGIIDHRWKEFSKNRQVLMLQQYDIGQPCLDCQIIYYENGEYKSCLQKN